MTRKMVPGAKLDFEYPTSVGGNVMYSDANHN